MDTGPPLARHSPSLAFTDRTSTPERYRRTTTDRSREWLSLTPATVLALHLIVTTSRRKLYPSAATLMLWCTEDALSPPLRTQVTGPQVSNNRHASPKVQVTALFIGVNCQFTNHSHCGRRGGQGEHGFARLSRLYSISIHREFRYSHPADRRPTRLSESSTKPTGRSLRRRRAPRRTLWEVIAGVNGRKNR